MKKALIGVVFTCLFTVITGIKTVQAAINDNFTKISFKTDLSQKSETNKLVHVFVELTDYQKSKFDKDVPLAITWNNSSKFHAEGINKIKDIIVKDENNNKEKVGTYQVNKDSVAIRFNDNIKNFKHIAGKISFDILVNNTTNNDQDLIINAGSVTEKLTVEPANENILSIFAIGKISQLEDIISWEIKVNSIGKDLEAPIKVVNELGQNLEIDQDSVVIEIDDSLVKLDKEQVKFDANKMLINLDNSKFLHEPFTIRYKTKILDSNLKLNANKIQIEYQLNNSQKRKTFLTKAKVLADLATVFSGIQNDDREEVRSKILENMKKDNDELAILFANMLKALNKNNRVVSDQDNASAKLVAKPIAAKLEAAEKVSPKGLSGFADKKQLSLKKDKDSDHDIDKIKTVKNISSQKHNLKKNTSELPKAGESENRVLCLVGIFIIFLVGMLFKIKIQK